MFYYNLLQSLYLSGNNLESDLQGQAKVKRSYNYSYYAFSQATQPDSCYDCQPDVFNE